jgi:hypothetical protein
VYGQLDDFSTGHSRYSLRKTLIHATQADAVGRDTQAIQGVDPRAATPEDAYHALLCDTLIELLKHPSQEVLLQRIVEQAAAMARLATTLLACDATLERPAPRPTVLADTGWLEEVFANLISNAAKYSGNAPPIVLGAEENEGWVGLTVADHGPGVPPERTAELFEEYTRLTPGTAEGFVWICPSCGGWCGQWAGKSIIGRRPVAERRSGSGWLHHRPPDECAPTPACTAPGGRIHPLYLPSAVLSTLASRTPPLKSRSGTSSSPTIR